MGRPKKEIDWDEVEKRIEIGNTARQIATCMRIGLNIFYDKFKEKYDVSFGDIRDDYVECGKANIEYNQYLKALEGSIPMLTWLGKVKCGQKEPESVALVAANQPIIDQNHLIMQLQHRITELEANANKPKAE